MGIPYRISLRNEKGINQSRDNGNIEIGAHYDRLLYVTRMEYLIKRHVPTSFQLKCIRPKL